jgi:hypothetical protein
LIGKTPGEEEIVPNCVDTEVAEWLLENAGPIIRWRMAKDLGVPVSKKEYAALRKAALETVEVKRWLEKLGGENIHGSKDTDAENAMAKLVEYGVEAGIPAFDRKMLPYAARVGKYSAEWVSGIVGPFLIAAGYGSHDSVSRWFRSRLDGLHKTALGGDYDLYLPDDEARKAPKAWRGKRIYRPEFGWVSGYPIPNRYDLYALAHWTPRTSVEKKKIEDIVGYLSHPLFQSTPGGYLWDRKKNTCFAAGRACLAVLTPERTVLFVELGARFAAARKSQWFQDALAELERHRTNRGTYRFPTGYLQEKRNSYFISQGAHMGLGENRRNQNWSEIESTFRMLNIKRLMQSGATRGR